ncbi:MAG: hypothetical protein KAI07_04515 [Deltaproteobacteria bacterium]|nr:hypothetical protein [Deltaproteobacteria bacterium]
MDIERAMLDPGSVFSSPEDVVKTEGITREQKIEILRHWEYDARELEVAAEESMLGNNSDMLDQILEALNKLGAEHDPHSDAPTKQGGV